jgi:hypothetical protein
MTKRTRHPEVNQESPIRFEPKNQILATAHDGRDSLALELSCHVRGVQRAREACIGDLDPLEPSPFEDGCEARAYALDLG